MSDIKCIWDFAINIQQLYSKRSLPFFQPSLKSVLVGRSWHVLGASLLQSIPVNLHVQDISGRGGLHPILKKYVINISELGAHKNVQLVKILVVPPKQKENTHIYIYIYIKILEAIHASKKQYG